MLCFIALKKKILQMILRTRFVLFTRVMLQLLWSSTIDLNDLELAILKGCSGCPATMNTDFIKAMLAENPQYSVQEMFTNISRKMINNHLIRMCELIWNLDSTAINGNRFYKPCLYMLFLFSTIWKKSFFKEVCHWKLEFCIKICIKNALDLIIGW